MACSSFLLHSPPPVYCSLPRAWSHHLPSCTCSHIDPCQGPLRPHCCTYRRGHAYPSIPGGGPRLRLHLRRGHARASTGNHCRLPRAFCLLHPQEMAMSTPPLQEGGPPPLQEEPYPRLHFITGPCPSLARVGLTHSSTRNRCLPPFASSCCISGRHGHTSTGNRCLPLRTY